MSVRRPLGSQLSVKLASQLRVLPTPGSDLALDVDAQVCGPRQSLRLGGQLVGSPVGVLDADDAVRGVGVLRSADHAANIRPAYARRPVSRLTVHMHRGRVLHMHSASLAGISTCRHKDYLMTCEQFDDLLNRSQQRCEICRRHGVDTSHGQLYIDHDKWRGMWAVRGLLCGRCNSMLEHEEHFAPEVASYLRAAWWRPMLADLGLGDRPEEPPLGTVVYAGQCCQWKRDDKGWFCRCGRHRHRSSWQRRTWHQLLRSFGPHRIRIP